MNTSTITPTDNGPYVVQGDIALIDADGNAYEVDDTIALCRCGLSTNKPFCDGSHEKNFHAVNRATSEVVPLLRHLHA
jgi:CDGSH iron-sulfur domain-containing protein 3